MLLRRRTPRCLTAFLLVLSLLFSQLALANYVCPAAESMAAMSSMVVAGEPCQAMDDAQPALCYQYAAGSFQAVEQLKVVTHTLPALVQVLFVSLVPQADDALTLPLSAEPEVYSPPEPVFLSTLRFRV